MSKTKRDTVKWDRVQKWVEREKMNTYWRPYGYPSIMNATESAFSAAAPMPRWADTGKVIISAAINGAFFTKRENPHQPTSPEEIIRSAEECIEAGAQIIHIHARDARGYNVLDTKVFGDILGDLRGRHPDLAFDACLVAVNDEESAQMTKMVSAGLVDAVPVNTTAIILGDNLFVKPPHAIIEKTRMVIEAGLKPQLAVYTDGDVDNARRLLIDSGLVETPLCWLVLPGLPGCSPMYDPEMMAETLLRMSRLIRAVDPGAIIMVCAGGRASSYLATQAMLLGLHVRVGMEDTVWKWPHRDDLIDNNAAFYREIRRMAESLGREVMSAAEYKALFAGPATQAAKPKRTPAKASG